MCPVVLDWEWIIRPNRCRFEDVLWDSNCSALYFEGYEQTVVRAGCCEAFIRWFHVTIRRLHLNSCRGGQVDYVPVSAAPRKNPGPSKKHSSPGKGKIEVSPIPVKLPRCFEVLIRPVTPRKQAVVEDPTFASSLASQHSHRRSRLIGRARTARLVFQGGLALAECVWPVIL